MSTSWHGLYGSGPPDAQLVADTLHHHRSDILRTYEERLRAIGSPLVHDPVVRDECLRHAEDIMVDVEASIVLGYLSLDSDGWRMARQVGASRAAERIHPNESLQAAAELFKIVLTGITDRFPPDTLSTATVLAFSLALNASITRRIQQASSAYAAFLLGKIREANVDERRRIAREIHDRVAQTVAVTQQNLDRYSPDEPDAGERFLSRARSALNQTALSIRQVTSDLRLIHPVAALEPALREFLVTAAPEAIEAAVDVNGEERWVRPEVRDQVFLIVREALRNAIAHARPKRLQVRIDIAPHELRARIDDDGIGVDTGDDAPQRGGGLTSMRERAELLGGRITIASASGAGTHIHLLVPLERSRCGDDF